MEWIEACLISGLGTAELLPNGDPAVAAVAAWLAGLLAWTAAGEEQEERLSDGDAAVLTAEVEQSGTWCPSSLM